MEPFHQGGVVRGKPVLVGERDGCVVPEGRLEFPAWVKELRVETPPAIAAAITEAIRESIRTGKPLVIEGFETAPERRTMLKPGEPVAATCPQCGKADVLRTDAELAVAGWDRDTMNRYVPDGWIVILRGSTANEERRALALCSWFCVQRFGEREAAEAEARNP